jgi:hypothetical protein
MLPAIGLKFLRDGVDSANTFGVFTLEGQMEYDFFKNDLSTIFATPVQEDSDWEKVGEHFVDETHFTTSIGNSNLAEYTQEGELVEEPVFPFRLIFEPAEDVKGLFPEEYSEPLHEQLQTIQPGSTLYKVFAVDKPDWSNSPHWHGEEKQEIGKIVLGSTLVTSLWGDEHMYFRHQRMDEDLSVHPEWLSAVPPSVGEPTIRPFQPKVESKCPFAFLF